MAINIGGSSNPRWGEGRFAIVDGRLTFPDESKGQLDEAISNLIERAAEVLRSQGRLRTLIRANQAVVEHLDLPTVLRTIVESAVELVGARYGALGVLGSDCGLEQFITVGMTPAEAAAIRALPHGLELFGALIDDPAPIRLEHLAADPRSAGSSPAHSNMESFLGVPVRVRGEVYGHLYLSNAGSGCFSAEDEQLVEALAATAGFAIDNARLFAETTRRQAWSAASAEITAALLSDGYEDSIDVLVRRVLAIADADLVCVMLPTSEPDQLIVDAVHGDDAAILRGRLISSVGSLAGCVLESCQPQLVHDGAGDMLELTGDRSLGPIMVVPLDTAGSAEGVLLVGRLLGRLRFTTADLAMAAGFAGQAAVAMALVKARSAEKRMVLLEERGRIARDLHDNVIQQLFGTGLELQSIAGAIAPAPEAGRVLDCVAALDGAIAQIRTVIFALTPSRSVAGGSIRHRLVDLVREWAPALGYTPSIGFTGPVETLVTGELADDVVAVGREALSNIVRHAASTRSSVTLDVSGSTVTIVVTNDGAGSAASGRQSGLANLRERAVRHGGELDFHTDTEGSVLRWWAVLTELSE